MHKDFDSFRTTVNERFDTGSDQIDNLRQQIELQREVNVKAEESLISRIDQMKSSEPVSPDRLIS